jgi:hypothetical protein
MTLVATVLVAVFVLHPQKKAIAEIDKSIDEVEQAIIASKTGGPGSDEERFAAQLAAARKKVSGYVVGPEQALDFALYISLLAKRAGVVDFSSTHRMQDSYGPIDECDHIVEGRMQIKYTASYDQFARFVNSLERNHPVIFIDNFTIRRSGKGKSGHSVDMVLTFFVGQDSVSDIRDVNGKIEI